MRIKPIGARPFSFQPSRRPDAPLRFNVGRTPFVFRRSAGGYTLSSGKETYQVAYRRGTARITIADGRARTRIQYDFHRWPTVDVQATASRGRVRLSGDVRTAALQALQLTGLEHPKVPKLKTLFSQINASPQFWHRLNISIAAAIPYDDYFPYFQRVPGGAGGRGAGPGSCEWWCMICAAVVLGTPGEPIDDIIACAICICCKAGTPNVDPTGGVIVVQTPGSGGGY